MLQKTIWMRFLIFGISIFILFSVFSCDSTESNSKSGTYIYKNQSGHNLILQLTNANNQIQNFPINVGESKKFVSRGEDGNVPFYSIDGSIIVANTATLIFDNDNCITYNRDNSDGIVLNEGTGFFNVENYDDYSESILEKNSFTLNYTITKDIFNLATPCN